MITDFLTDGSLMPTCENLMSLLLYALAVILFMAGLLGCVLPYPGTMIVLGGCVAWAVAQGAPYPGYGLWALLAVLALVGCFTDTIFSLMGAKRFGSSRAAVWCSALGLFIGAFFFPLGLILGPFLGAFLAEMLLVQRNLGDSAKSGAGALLGALAGMAVKFLIAGGILLIFFWIA